MDREILLRDDELKIPTRITLPDRMVPRRVVLGVHGLGGSMDDEIQQSIAEEMAFFRAACVRFDLPCHGKSPMGPGDFTLDYSVRSLLAAAKFAREAFRDTEGLCVFATGFGAYVTLVALPQLLELTTNGFYIFATSFPVAGYAIFCSGFFTALNDGLSSAVISFLRTVVFQIAAVLLLPLVLDIDGIWWSITVAETMAVATGVVFLFLKRNRFHYM